VITEKSQTKTNLTAEDFLARLDADKEKALRIHRELERLVSAFVKKTLAAMFGRFQEDDVSKIVNQTFLIGYHSFARQKPLDFSNPPESLQSYFWCIAQNVCKTFRREKYRSDNLASLTELSEEGREVGFTANNPESELIEKEESGINNECQNKALLKLKSSNPEDFDLLLSYYSFEGKTPQEVKKHRESLAEKMNIDTKYLAIIVFRIRNTVKKDYANFLANRTK
jgi:DNA-directed RNA polymerase specialized sigma24 family protein